MDNHAKFELAIVGGGGAGTMAYLRAVLNWDRVVLFSGNADTKRRGRGTWVADVDNIPGLHGMKRPVVTSQKTTLNWLRDQPTLKDVGLVLAETVTSVRTVEKGFVLAYENAEGTHEIEAKYIILATGVMDRQPRIQGSMDPIFPYANRGDFIYCVRCDGHKTIGKKLSILGHGDGAAQIAAILIERYGHQDVAICTNGESAQFSPEGLDLIALYGMAVHTSPIRLLRGNLETGLEGFLLQDGTEVKTERAVVALGTLVYNDLAKSLNLDLDEDGKVWVGPKYETSLNNVFAVGDLISEKKMQIYTAWDEAVDAADEINRRLRLQKREARRIQK